MATRAISKLNILIGATTVGLQRGFATAKSQIRGFEKQLENTFGAQRFRSIKANFTAITAGIAAAGAATAVLAHQFNESRQQIDELAKSASTLGVSFESLRALSIVAEESGTSFADLRRGYGRMLDTIADADDEVGNAVQALSRLGLEAEDLMAIGPERALEEIATQLASIENEARRIQVARDIFGRAGEQIVLALERIGEDGIAGVRQELEMLGGAISGTDAQRVERMNDALTRLNTAVSLAIERVVALNADAITEIVEAFTRLAVIVNRTAAAVENLEKKWPLLAEVLDQTRIDPVNRAFMWLLEQMEILEETPRDPVGVRGSREEMERVLALMDEAQRRSGITALDIRTSEGAAEAGRLMRQVSIV